MHPTDKPAEQHHQTSTDATLFTFDSPPAPKKRRSPRPKAKIGDVSLFGPLTAEDIWRMRMERTRRRLERKRKPRKSRRSA